MLPSHHFTSSFPSTSSIWLVFSQFKIKHSHLILMPKINLLFYWIINIIKNYIHMFSFFIQFLCEIVMVNIKNILLNANIFDRWNKFKINRISESATTKYPISEFLIDHHSYHLLISTTTSILVIPHTGIISLEI